MLDFKTILITGGTGSLGHALVELIHEAYKPFRVIVFSRDEYKQHIMQKDYDYPWLRYFVGDVRDEGRLQQVMGLTRPDIVIHAAALKQIPTIEYNPLEAVKTNVNGTSNVIETCVGFDVDRCVLISTDKAVQPINLYGATKLAAERLVLAANAFNRTKFSVVRYGNVLNSRGSVIELFLKLMAEGETIYPITDMEMTRFWITLQDAAKLVLTALNGGGSLVIPKLPSMKITEIARAINPDCQFRVTGIRPGEKLHESLDIGYSSDTNDVWMSREELRRKLGL